MTSGAFLATSAWPSVRSVSFIAPGAMARVKTTAPRMVRRGRLMENRASAAKQPTTIRCGVSREIILVPFASRGAQGVQQRLARGPTRWQHATKRPHDQRKEHARRQQSAGDLKLEGHFRKRGPVEGAGGQPVQRQRKQA